MSKFIGFVIGAAEVVAGIVLLGTPGGQALGVELIISGAGMIISQAVVDLTMPKGSPSPNAQETTLQLGEVARRAIFGKTATAGSLVDAFDYGGKYGTDNEVVIFALADHKCEELVGVYVNDIWVPWVGDGNYPAFNGVHYEHLHMYFRDGSPSQTLPSVVTTHGPGWTSSDSGDGVCYAVVDYRCDTPNSKNPIWPGGRPKFLWVVKGKKCYDPRLDDTVSGGSGSHRWDDPSTWEWSQNPIVCAYNWRRGIYACDLIDQPEMLLIGRGLTETEARPADIIAYANLCDEVMDDSLPRYTIGGIIAADEKYIDVEEKFASSVGGVIIQPNGTVAIEPAEARTPSFSFTDDDLVVGTTVEWNEGILSEASDEWINTVIPQYVEPNQKWQDHAAPVRRVEADLIADGGSRELDVSLPLVTVQRQASDVGEIHRKLGRIWGRGSAVLPPGFAEVEEGDWGTYTSPRRLPDAPDNTITIRVESYGLDAKWQNSLTFREISSAVYDGVLGSGSSTGSADDWEPTTPPIDVGAPDSGNWALAAVSVNDNGVSRPALEITGDSSDDTSVESIIVEYWKSDGVIDPITNPDDPTWVTEGVHAPSITKLDITGVEGGAVYYVALTYVVTGISGDRLVLGPVTATATDIVPAVNAVLDGRPWKNPVRAKTTAALAANTYANGSSGVGATLTANANGSLAAQDGVTLVANDRLLVDQEATGSHNGIYSVTQVGDGSHPYILTRTTDADSGAELVNATVKVSEGTTFADQEWQCTTNATITVGTTSLVWARFPDIQKLLDVISSTQGAIIYRSSSSWLALAAGTSGQVLQTNGAGADPSWGVVGAGVGGAMTLISLQTVAGAAVSSVTFTSIPATYKDLVIVSRARSTAAAAAANLLMRFNNDTGSNYDTGELNSVGGTGATPSWSANTAQSSLKCGAVSAGSSVNSNRFGNLELTVMQYANTTYEKDIVGFGWDNASHTIATMRLQQRGGTWRNTAAINRIDFLMDTGNIDIGTVIALYGRS